MRQKSPPRWRIFFVITDPVLMKKYFWIGVLSSEEERKSSLSKINKNN